MRMFIGLLAFWLSTFGYIQLLKKKTKLPMEFSLPTIFTIISISMFIGGILNMLKEFAVIICILGIVLLFYSIIKKEIEFRKLLNFNFIAIFLILLYLTIICKDMHLMIYDNFSHWGLIVKSMFMKNCLPNFESIIEFRDYQPGSACFIYYFSLFAGKTEGNAIIAQNYLIVSFFFSLFAFTNGKNKINYLSKILLIVSFLFILFGNVQFYDLPVDTLISVISICSLSVIYYFRKDLKRAFSYVLPFSVYLFLVKNVGIILVGLNCLALLYIGYKNKELKKGFIYAVYTVIITLIFYYIWSKHVSYVYYIGNTISKHSLRLNNIAASIKGYGIDRTKTFLNIYFNHFMDVFNNLPHKYMIIINIIFIILIIFYKKYRKRIIKFLAISDIIYLGYYLILGLMYIMSMPWDEAKVLACFNRYMLTIVFLVIGILFICIFNIIKSENKRLTKSYLLMISLIVLSLFVNLKYNVTNYKIFIGNQNYKNSIIYRFDKILDTDIFLGHYDKTYYYVYAPKNTENGISFIWYLSKYKLNSDKVIVINKLEDFKEEENLNYYKEVILLEEDKNIYNYLEDYNYDEISSLVYLKKPE